jgi:hypothetical protein
VIRKTPVRNAGFLITACEETMDFANLITPYLHPRMVYR